MCIYKRIIILVQISNQYFCIWYLATLYDLGKDFDMHIQTTIDITRMLWPYVSLYQRSLIGSGVNLGSILFICHITGMIGSGLFGVQNGSKVTFGLF